MLSRAAASLRSIETKPFDSEICPLPTDTFPRVSFLSFFFPRDATGGGNFHFAEFPTQGMLPAEK